MSYIGNTPTQQNFVAGADQFNGNGSTTAFTLSRNVNTVFDIFVAISNVPQDPYSAYSVSGNTLTFTSAPPSGTGNIYVVYRATNVQTFVPSPGVSTQFGLGSAAAPSMTFIGNTTTGVFSPATNTLAFSTNGTEDARFDSSGNFGVGTTSPIRKLTVAASSSPEFVLQETSGSTDAKNWRIFNSGNRLYFGTLNDAGTSGTDTFSINSSGVLLNASGKPVLRQTGSVLQVINVYKTDTQTISSGTPTFVDITGLSITITPASSSSTFLVMWSVAMGNGTDASHGYVRLNRNGTAIALANAAGNRTTASSGIVNTAVAGQSLVTSNSYLDSPATASAITYKLTASNNNVGSSSTFINRSSRDTDLTGYDGRSTSSLTVMEISA